ncbi:DUF438 domain-containing protein [Texcoconibacillus texcoconensis]|uniref:DUF438 domain-containing protein n=1 Tax=Texcoconibacillus texcoconensis TaxID=1095777 RepID=A0A840QPQ1_9BACI|nr:DUF438 domain-containing protein [Texcoconibacillus texcoconensis]MBB5173392.1 hypothetical protein [Texcoconibacillus texcoconensis]
MSELINNRKAKKNETSERQALLKEIIKELHDGKNVDDVKAKFEEAIEEVSVSEISQMEQSLMEEEGIPVEEVQRLCSVHTEVFKGSIEEIHESEALGQEPGHPVHTFVLENKEIDPLVNFRLSLHKDQFVREANEETVQKLIDDLTSLLEIGKHYERKENLLLPYLEKYGIHGPTQVMWGVDDRIRAAMKKARLELMDGEWTHEDMVSQLEWVIKEVSDMIFKEENILLPMALQHLTEDEWIEIEAESDELGYCFIEAPQAWKPKRERVQTERTLDEGIVRMETGTVSIKQLELIMNHLPIDLTFIDDQDIFRYFSHGKDRIFHRSTAQLGRTVQNCHPPQSVHIVNQILEDFKSGKKDSEDFWIPLKDKYVLIRYFAVRDEEGTYLGTLEFTQNIAPIQEIEGEKRLMS